MTVALWLLAAQGIIGAFDTIYYHEWRARLAARGKAAAIELKLHACRDFLYAVLFGTLPFLAWSGNWALALLAVVVAEIVLTLWDFVVEIAVRRSLGDVYAGERVTHAVMGILYGAMLAFLAPVVVRWQSMPTRLELARPPIPEMLRWILLAMAIGVFLSGLRDLYAAFELPRGGWPWSVDRAASPRSPRDRSSEVGM
jgi:hypothetical protein